MKYYKKTFKSISNWEYNKLFRKEGNWCWNLKEITECKKVLLKTQQRFKSESHNVFTEETNKIDLSSNYNKRMQSIDSIETYAYGTSKVLISN